MWILNKETDKVDRYLQLMKDNLSIRFRLVNLLGGKKLKTKVIPKELTNTRSYQFLDENRFWKYLIAEPHELLNMHNELFSYIINDSFIQKEWEEVLKGSDNMNLRAKYASINSTNDNKEIDFIKHMFNYKNYIQSNKHISFGISKIMDINTCTYCNQQYIITIEEGETKLIRPEFDHWFPQCYYPDLALSYYNLIPSCKHCNSTLKHDKMMTFDKYIHPYNDDKTGFSFRYIPMGNGYSVDVQIDESLSNDYQQKVKETLRLFKTQEIYNAHSEFELKDLLEISRDYPGDYIETLLNTVIKDLNVSEEDVYRMLFGIEYEVMKYHIRPFSKFKNDIIKQIKKERNNNGSIQDIV